MCARPLSTSVGPSSTANQPFMLFTTRTPGEPYRVAKSTASSNLSLLASTSHTCPLGRERTDDKVGDPGLAATTGAAFELKKRLDISAATRSPCPSAARSSQENVKPTVPLGPLLTGAPTRTTSAFRPLLGYERKCHGHCRTDVWFLI